MYNFAVNNFFIQKSALVLRNKFNGKFSKYIAVFAFNCFLPFQRVTTNQFSDSLVFDQYSSHLLNSFRCKP